MAAIDKIYGTREQQIEFRAWCKNNCPEALVYFSPEEFWDEPDWMVGEHPITCFPEEIDMWMLGNCTIGWVVEYIKDQYGIE